jgi:hypothetical protein
MKKQFLVVLVSFLMFQNYTFASTDNWEAVMKQKKGKTLNILLNSGRWITADVEMVDQNKLLVENGIGRYEIFRKVEISEVYLKTGSIGKSVLIGTAATVGVVLLTGIIVESGYPGEDKYMMTCIATMFAIPVGASIGLVDGILKEHKKMIYKSDDRHLGQEETQVTLEPLAELQDLTKINLFPKLSDPAFEMQAK